MVGRRGSRIVRGEHGDRSRYDRGVARRHESLIPLTHDHHHALHNARLLREAADGAEDERRAATDEFLAFFREYAVQHFREEEEELFPLVIDAPDAPSDAIARVLVEHVRLHALVRSLADDTSDPVAMRTLAELLRAHVRFEEDELFPAIERVTSGLERLRLAPRARP